MRISCDPSDPGYENYAKHTPGGVRVYLNGRELDQCVTADEENRYVVVYDCGPDGKPRIDGDGEVRFKALHGLVRVVTGQGWRQDERKPEIDWLELNREFSS